MPGTIYAYSLAFSPNGQEEYKKKIESLASQHSGFSQVICVQMQILVKESCGIRGLRSSVWWPVLEKGGSSLL